LGLSEAASWFQANEFVLDGFVNRPDSSYSWRLFGSTRGENYTDYLLEMVSQNWLSLADVNRTNWVHWLRIIVPDYITTNTALLYIVGGSNRNPPPTLAPPRTLNLALKSQSVVADIGMVPNQPLIFSHDSDRKGRYETDLWAYCRAQAKALGDETWLLQLPMVKSAVRAMDTVTEFVRAESTTRMDLSRFVVVGGSKRAVTALLTAAVDTRVCGVIPISSTALNESPMIRHQYSVYGDIPLALNDFAKHGVYSPTVDFIDSCPLLQLEDPYLYRCREGLKVPKYIINASGCQYYSPDSSRFYFSDLQGEKHLRYVANARHSLDGTDVPDSVLAFYKSILDGRKRPRYEWVWEDNENIRISVHDDPQSVVLWEATNLLACDFMLDTTGDAWKGALVTERSKQEYVCQIRKPASGFKAAFVELVYTNPEGVPLKLTSDVSVIGGEHTSIGDKTVRKGP
jgi:PhoPQ-activated pathogenicity-related protein